MGAKKPKAKKVEAVQLQSTANADALARQANESIGVIQRQSQATIDEINKQNQASAAAIQQQLAQANQEKANYQQSLTKYLEQLNSLQSNYNQALSTRDKEVSQANELQQKEIEGNTMMNSLLAASAIAKQAFNKQTSKRRGIIG
jgi:hypothetical protein